MSEPARLVAGSPQYRRAIYALLAGGLAIFLLLYITQGLLPQIAADLHVGPAEAALTVSVTSGALAISLIPMSIVAERFGRAPVMKTSAFAASILAVIIPFAPNIATLVLLRGLQGVAIAGVPACAMAYLGEEVESISVTAAMGLYLAGNSLGGLSSRVVAGLISQVAGWRVALGVLGILSLCCAVAFALLLPEERHFVAARTGPRRSLHNLGQMLTNRNLVPFFVLGGLLMFIFGGAYTVLGFRLEAAPFGLSEALVGLFFTIYLVGTATGPYVGRIEARFGERRLILIGIAVVILGFAVTWFDSIALIVLGFILITAGFFGGHTVASSEVSIRAVVGRSQASAMYLTAYYIGNSAGASTAAIVYHDYRWDGVIVIAIAAMLAAAGVAATISSRHA